MTQPPSFVTVRSKIITLETQTETLLQRFSTFAQTTSSEQTGQERKIDSQIETILQKRQDIIDELNDICQNNSNISATKLSQLQRHKEVLSTHWKSFHDIRSSIQQERNRLNLLFSVKNDIAQHNSNNNIEDADEYMQNESRRIDQSHSIVDRLISDAWETRERFASQSSGLHTTNNKVLTTLQRIPGVNQVINNIGSRRRKNVLIMASVTTICILILFFTW